MDPTHRINKITFVCYTGVYMLTNTLNRIVCSPLFVWIIDSDKRYFELWYKSFCVPSFNNFNIPFCWCYAWVNNCNCPNGALVDLPLCNFTFFFVSSTCTIIPDPPSFIYIFLKTTLHSFPKSIYKDVVIIRHFNNIFCSICLL